MSAELSRLQKPWRSMRIEDRRGERRRRSHGHRRRRGADRSAARTRRPRRRNPRARPHHGFEPGPGAAGIPARERGRGRAPRAPDGLVGRTPGALRHPVPVHRGRHVRPLGAGLMSLMGGLGSRDERARASGCDRHRRPARSPRRRWRHHGRRHRAGRRVHAG